MSGGAGWFSCVRAVLEVLYFLSGVTIAVIALKGLRQVRAAAEQARLASEQLGFAREIADTNSKREAAKLAAEQCKYFAEQCVPAYKVLQDKYREKKLSFFHAKLRPGEPHFKVKNDHFENANCDSALIEREYPQVEFETLNVLNRLEFFSILFADEIADEEIGYRETALGFCECLDFLIVGVYHLRNRNRAQYSSVLKLYERWSRRIRE